MLLGHELFNVFYFKKSLYKNKLPYFLHFGGYFMFCYQYFISSWKQIGVLRWRWVPMLMMILLALISLKHQDCCSLSSFLLYKLMWLFSNDTCYLQSSVNHIQHKNKISDNVWEPHTEGKNCDKQQYYWAGNRFIYLGYRIAEYKSDLVDKLQTYNKINGTIRRHSWLHRASNNVEISYYQLMHIMLKNTELLKHSKITLQHVSVYIETIFRELQSVLG